MNPKQEIVTLYNILASIVASRYYGTPGDEARHEQAAEALARAVREAYPDVADTLTGRLFMLYTVFGDAVDEDVLDNMAQSIRDERGKLA